ncbi:MAG: ribose-5-phosphate isomerase RpiA [Candidatus Altiarchaeales archaeon]|nr:ribose-5-phosphate isomerase RpiA [Candidatus Altiarchaeales archaeon]
MANEQSKRTAALKALEYVKPGMKLGLGTGTTAGFFIEELAKAKIDVTCVPSSNATETLARSLKLKLIDLNTALAAARIGEIPQLDLCVDGADEADKKFNLIKGGGGALTREKVVASASKEFIVIIDDFKWVDKIGKYPLPIEVLPFAQKFVESEIKELGGTPKLREKFTTDNRNIILDVTGLDFSDPLDLEGMLNNIPGVVDNGIFAIRNADMVIMGKGKEFRVFEQ